MRYGRWIPFLFLAPAFLLVVSACGDTTPALPGSEALAEVEEGTPRDEVMALLPQGELDVEAQTLNGYRLNRYLADGSTIEVVWLHRQGSGGEFQEPRQDMTPVVFRDGALDGWGWAHFDERAEAWSLPVPETPLTDEG